ncbi:hypothetical protein ACFSJ3_10440 [Corallincola platygyrae]|uniref:Uncharacterized protein n=1 Tax=Corallincola platygyrae TaxID=1193278 RepID=A0ABW4XMF3_9GAMM
MKRSSKLVASFGLGLILVAGLVSELYADGKIVVRKSSEPREVSIWEQREQMQQEKEFEQWLRMQQDWQWISQLPPGCILRKDLRGSYDCGGRYYWPYRGEKQEYFIEVDPRELSGHKKMPAPIDPP